ncbi:MAG: tubulin-like doman-containing protein, partial [Candidatus Marinimicrobia bacterium]|nr:tubulin-like doman-containing protein [Candidatus Neomarinimicrobiota bacterium]
MATHGLSVDKSGGVNIYIIGSLCGGTGSGQFIDVAYLCRKVAAQYTLKVHGIFGLPNLFQKATAGSETDNRANAYAALQELNHFMETGNYDCLFSGKPYKFDKTPPFNSVFLIDSPNEENHGLAERDEACDMIAHALFGLTASQTRKTYDEYYTNFSSSIGINVPNRKGVEFKSSFSSFGTAALVYPVKKLNKACCMWQGEQLCQQVLTTTGSLTDFSSEAEKMITVNLEPARRVTELLGNYEKLLASWMNNGFNSLVGLKDKAIADQLESLKVDLEADIIPRLKKRL